MCGSAFLEDRKVARNTVLTMLTRLEEGSWLERDLGRAHARYRAAAFQRAATLGTMLSRLVQTAFGGSAEGLLVALLQDRGVSKEEAEVHSRKSDDRSGRKTREGEGHELD